MSASVPAADYGREAMEFTLPREHVQLTGNTTVKLYKVPAGRKLRVDRVQYINVTGLARSDTDSFVIEARNGATVVATVANTGTVASGGAAIAANTNITVQGVDGANVLAEGEELSVVFTETGTATLPAGFYIIEGRLL